MLFRLIEKTYDAVSITAPVKSAAVDVAANGGDSLAYQMVATAASTPGTATIGLEGSLDGVSYIAVGSTTSVAANGVFTLTLDRPPLRYYRVSYAIASGSYTSTLKCLVKGDKA